MTLIQDHYIEYIVYTNMIRNCYPSENRTTTYEKNKIGICSEWLEGGFYRFLEDMGTKPSDKHKLFRINPNKDFCKDNCKWSLETPRRVDNIIITFKGITKNLSHWCDEYKMDYGNTFKKIQRLVKKEKTHSEAFKIIRDFYDKKE